MDVQNDQFNSASAPENEAPIPSSAAEPHPEPQPVPPVAPEPPPTVQAPPQAYAPQPPPGKGMSIAAMVLGICSLVLTAVFYLSTPGVIVGIVLSALSLKRKLPGRGMAIAGLVTSIVCLAILLIIFLGAAYRYTVVRSFY